MSRTFTLKGKKYRIDVKKAASALIGVAGLAAWLYVIAILEKAVLLG